MMDNSNNGNVNVNAKHVNDNDNSNNAAASPTDIFTIFSSSTDTTTPIPTRTPTSLANIVEVDLESSSSYKSTSSINYNDNNNSSSNNNMNMNMNIIDHATATSGLSSPSDEQKEQSTIETKEKGRGGDGDGEGGYYSIPESGNAVNVGYNNCNNDNNNNSNSNSKKDLQSQTGSGSCRSYRSYTTAMEEEQSQSPIQVQTQTTATNNHNHNHDKSQLQSHHSHQQQQQPFEDDYDNDDDDKNDGIHSTSLSKSLSETFKRVAVNDTTTTITNVQSPSQKRKFFVQACYLSIAAIISTLLRYVATTTSNVQSQLLLQLQSYPQKRKVFVQACYLSIAAIIGTLLRLILAQLFGQACSNPGSIGYIKDSSVLCVTSNGETTQNEGIIFADLPANLLGSFIMGLLQDGNSLGLAINMPIAFVKPTNIFQSYDIWHLALRTGFCGSLTTFSAWNSEMVVLLVGNHEAMPNRESMIWKALFGYIIGMETAIGSYVFGRTVAWWLHRWINPQLAYEQREMNIREKKHGISINRLLPQLERRYLHSLFENNYNNNNNNSNTNNKYDGCANASRSNDGDGEGGSNSSSRSQLSTLSPTYVLTQEELEPLFRWRESTKVARRVESGDEISNKLIELETALIVRNESIPKNQQHHLEITALYYGWDIDALQEWLSKRKYYDTKDQVSSASSAAVVSLTPAGISKTSEDDTVRYAPPVACLLLIILFIILIILMMHWDAQTSYDITYRTMAYSMLFAPPGALLRWKLSGWNGTLGTRSVPIRRLVRWKWLPIGTLAANVIGAMGSITMIGLEYNLGGSSGDGFTNNGFWEIATLRAIKIGFCGCLSTVSTFVSEVHKLTKNTSRSWLQVYCYHAWFICRYL
eukprot:CAMPEP_0170837686 /NCGR_PEP_ID=MMETSP0734-20130129/2889_1 /TAXON_ID=186038 /ORGANISM="Fragilariopsis kerguelensis, Strain L26-C5" /LENGTH=870 /DNA_ID=CAMNT_0011204869 /DNA_START=105 /DNA_END=2714 /DNA_ORIENTATION=+